MTLEVMDAKKVKLTEEDIRRVAEIHIHPEIREWDKYYQHRSKNDATSSVRAFKKFFKRLPKDKDQLFLLAKLDGIVVGFLGIHRLDEPRSLGDIGIEVHPDYQCKGIGTKLLQAGIGLAKEKGFKRLEADTLATNKAMRGAAEKVGFHLEGIKKKDTRIHNRLQDSALYSILL